MKYCLFFIIVFFRTGFNVLSYGPESGGSLYAKCTSLQDAPFYFLNPVPDKIKLFNNLNLSFFKNQLIVNQYRYRLETPEGVQTDIERRFLNWSGWTDFNLAELMIPRLDQEGGYKLVIEYKTKLENETKRFEQYFYVYKVYLSQGNLTADNKTPEKTGKSAVQTIPGSDRLETKTTTVPDRTVSSTTNISGKSEINSIANPEKSATIAGKPADNSATKITERGLGSIDSLTREKTAGNIKQLDLKDIKTEVFIGEKNFSQNAIDVHGTDKNSVNSVVTIQPDYETLLVEAMGKEDSVLFSTSIENGAGLTLKGDHGGNIFHLIDNNLASERLISMLKNRGFPINVTDNFGNTPLHFAILSGKSEYAVSLIKSGANMNLRNRKELTPLHLAVLLNDDAVVTELIKKGADVNLKGSFGYTALHLVSELNNINMAVKLLENGALTGLKTIQSLSPKAIAKIQNNYDMVKLISNKDSYTLSLPISAPVRNFSGIDPDGKQYPDIDFNLPYDKKLAKRRQSDKIIQIISVPVFAISGTVAIYLKSEADHYYSLSKTAETEALAKQYYDRIIEYDKFTYISGAVSLVSLYGFIHSSLMKKSVSKKMYKTF